MKLLLENFKKSMKEQFRGPTEEPSFSDPGYGEPEGFDELQDQATSMVDQVRWPVAIACSAAAGRRSVGGMRPARRLRADIARPDPARPNAALTG